MGEIEIPLKYVLLKSMVLSLENKDETKYSIKWMTVLCMYYH